jgi:DegV family protein with EDD domain
MQNVGVVTDSTACIPDDIMQELEIQWVPYYIHRGKEVLRDLVTIQRDAFYAWLPTAQELPKTASPGPGDYTQIYQKLYEEGYRDIVSIHMTSKGSGAYQAAMAAKTMIDETIPQIKIEVIDTLNVSMCHGWMVIEAARAAKKGKSLPEIVAQIRKMMPITRMLQTADTLRYLYMGGRIGKAKHLVGTLLKIKPIISMEDGVIIALGQARGRLEAYRRIADLVEKAVGTQGKAKVAYVHAASLGEIQKLREIVEGRINSVETILTELSPALGVHTGPGTVGVCYYPVDLVD